MFTIMKTKNILSKHTSKQRRKEERARIQSAEKAIQNALKHHNKVKKVLFPKMVEMIYEDNAPRIYKEHSLGYNIQLLFNAVSGRNNAKRRLVLKNLLLSLYKQRCTKLLRDKSYLDALYQISKYHHAFERDVATWKRNSHNPEKQIKDFIKHCFIKYPVPEFMYHVWLGRNSKYMTWFIDLTRGISVKNLMRVPVKLTKKGAHEFLLAPKQYNVAMALRRAQAKAFGSDDVTAERIASSRLSRNDFRNEVFWETVIRFFANQSMLDFNKMNEIMDYLDDCITNNVTYSIKGRTIVSLTRQSDEWHAAQAAYQSTQAHSLVWTPSLPSSMNFVEGKNEKRKKYRLYELCSSKALLAEGKKMGHCVATYAHSCYANRTRIFTLRALSLKGEETLATIEISPKTGTIVQAKARFNKAISNKAKEIMNDWAIVHGLKVSRWL